MRTELHILLVEDSRADAKIIARALSESAVPHRLTVLHDGRQALDYLARLDSPDAPEGHQPDLILLDLNLPGLDGCQVLSVIKSSRSSSSTRPSAPSPSSS
jgi:CheY-like chemotaxis protein